jgi:hypothetical protein
LGINTDNEMRGIKNKYVVLDPLNVIKTIYVNDMYSTTGLHDFEDKSSYC